MHRSSLAEWLIFLSVNVPNCFHRADKESGICRLEANYAHQKQLDMIPLLCEQGYKPKVGSGSGKSWRQLLLPNRRAA